MLSHCDDCIASGDLIVLLAVLGLAVALDVGGGYSGGELATTKVL